MENAQPQPQSQAQAQLPLEQTAKPLSPSAQLDLAITLALYNWPVLSLAVQSSWGGPTSSDKRDWFCGAIASLFTDRPDTDAPDLEEVLLQVMGDEFDVVVDDDSAGDVADKIFELKTEIEKGQFETLNKMWEQWKQKEARNGGTGNANISMFKKVDVRDEDQETDDDEDDEDEDIEMEDAPPPRPIREKLEPEIDEDGFTKVVGRRKR